MGNLETMSIRDMKSPSSRGASCSPNIKVKITGSKLDSRKRQSLPKMPSAFNLRTAASLKDRSPFSDFPWTIVDEDDRLREAWNDVRRAELRLQEEMQAFELAKIAHARKVQEDLEALAVDRATLEEEKKHLQHAIDLFDIRRLEEDRPSHASHGNFEPLFGRDCFIVEDLNATMRLEGEKSEYNWAHAEHNQQRSPTVRRETPRTVRRPTTSEAKSTLAAYNKKWTELASNDADVPFPSSSLSPDDLTISPPIGSFMVQESTEKRIESNVTRFFLAPHELLTPAAPDEELRIWRGKDDIVRELQRQMKKERTRWHPDRLGRRKPVKGGDEAIERLEYLGKSIFHAVSELYLRCKKVLEA